ncbi:MAG: tetratricopeptide repeat protein [Deltaproteobacteria bacterium]|nr:tetratricopeptide repeat protein [Deltaproteobacteria bacterium]
MTFSGTTLGFIAVAALLGAAIVLAILDRREKQRGHAEKARALSQLSLGLFLVAFVGGVVVTLLSGITPRPDMAAAMGPGSAGEGGMSPAGLPPGHPPVGADAAAGGAIGKVNAEEVAQLEARVAKNAKDVAALDRLGHLYLQQRNFEQVFEVAHNALKQDPERLESRVHLAMALFASGQADQAMTQFDRVLAKDPKHLEALLFKGMVQFQGQQNAEAARATWQQYLKHAKPTDDGYARVQAFLGMTETIE